MDVKCDWLATEPRHFLGIFQNLSLVFLYPTSYDRALLYRMHIHHIQVRTQATS